MSSLTPSQTKALDYKHHISLTANAGSGKTLVLSKRYLKIIEENDISLREIVAITFTDKSASELYKRIAQEIEDKLNSGLIEREYHKWISIRRELVSANISTIHSFCVDILRQYPVEANIDANFKPIDEKISEELLTLSIEDEIKRLFYDEGKSDDIKYLIRIFGSKSQLSEILNRLISKRKNIEDLISNILCKSESEIGNYFDDKYYETIKLLFESKYDETLETISKINNCVLENNSENQIAKDAQYQIITINKTSDFYEKLKKLFLLKNLITTKKSELLKRGYLSSNNREEFSDGIRNTEKYFKDLDKINFDLNINSVHLKLAEFNKKLLSIYNKCLSNYENRKSNNGYLDFEDILLYTKKILKTSDLITSISNKYKYIMVDEYQDTNELQYNIFLPILDYLKFGNLFVVGDEKQSIYKFRDADISIYNKTKNDINKIEGKDYLLSLPDSFRMSSVISSFINHIFSKLLECPNPLFNDVEFNEVRCGRNDDINGKVELLLNEDENSNEAELVAKRIIKLVTQDKWLTIEDEKANEILWKDIAILCSRRKFFIELEKELIEYNIPYNIIDGQGFYQRQPIYDLYNYFSFLLENKNDSAFLGVLRSPFFNISDSIIFEISLEYGESFWIKFSNYCKTHLELTDKHNLLKENISLSKETEIPVILRKILDESPFLATLASRKNGEQEIANIKKIISYTNNFSLNPFSTLFDYVEYLKDSIKNTNKESQAAVANDSNTIKIMTIHQAKGLEFSAVFLYGSAYSKKGRTNRVSIDKDFGLLTKLPYNDNYFKEYIEPPIYSVSNIINNKKEFAELKRLLYVAITRAKNYLFVSAEKEKIKENQNSFIALINSVLNLNYNEESYNFTSKLKSLIVNDNGYDYETNDVDVDIKIINNLEIEPIVSDSANDKTSKKSYNIDLSQIKDKPHGEIISATKVAVYLQCPLKYKFTYDLGLTVLYENYKVWKKDNAPNKYDFNYSEVTKSDENENNDKAFNVISPEIKGRVIHKILQMEISNEKLHENLKAIIEKELNLNNYDSKEINIFIDNILSDLNNYYNSKIFREIIKHKNYKNEFEIYLKENDYYLFGIIDKIIFEENKILIIDYKTDNIEEEQINERCENYVPQLTFYAHVIKNLFPNYQQIEYNLVFIKHPNVIIHREIKTKELNDFQKDLKQIVNNMREQNYKKNLLHCSRCLFTNSNGSCIK